MEPHLYEAAALSGWATNKAVPIGERLQAALQALSLYEARITNLTEELEEAHVRLMNMSTDNEDLRDRVVRLKSENMNRTDFWGSEVNPGI